MHKLYFHPWRHDITHLCKDLSICMATRGRKSIRITAYSWTEQKSAYNKVKYTNIWNLINKCSSSHTIMPERCFDRNTKIPILDSEMKAEHHLNRVRHLAAKRITSVTRSCIYPITVGLLWHPGPDVEEHTHTLGSQHQSQGCGSTSRGEGRRGPRSGPKRLTRYW